VQDRRKKTMVELEYSSVAQKGRGAAKWYVGRSSKKHSRERGRPNRYQKTIQNVERSVAKHRSREDRLLMKE